MESHDNNTICMTNDDIVGMSYLNGKYIVYDFIKFKKIICTSAAQALAEVRWCITRYECNKDNGEVK